MRKYIWLATCALVLLRADEHLAAKSAVEVLGRDYEFPRKVEGLPNKLSDFEGVEINYFKTSDGTTLSYWEAGEGKPLIFIPAWSANGAEYVNVMYLLRQYYHVYVIDLRNQGLSQHVDYGARISRHASDVKDFTNHLGIATADYCGWSMGASVLWSYIDLFGTAGIHKLIFIDGPISFYSQTDGSESERREAGSITALSQRTVAAIGGLRAGPPINRFIIDPTATGHVTAAESPSFENSESFAREFIKNDPNFLALILADSATSDWRDIIRNKIDIPTAIFTGEWCINLSSQQWMYRTIQSSTLYVYSKADLGDHFLASRNPVKFTQDLRTFLDGEE